MQKFKLIFIVFIGFSIEMMGQMTDLSTPRSAIYTHFENLKRNNYHPEISARTIYGISGEQAQKKAIRLKQIFEGKGLLIDFTGIPNDANFIDSLNYPIPKYAYKPFPYRLPEVYLEKYGDKWYYSKETIQKIDYLYESIYPFGADLIDKYVPSYFKASYLGLMLWQWIGLVLIILLTYFLHVFFKKLLFFIFKLVKKRFISSKIKNLNERLKQFAHPLSYIFGIYVMEMMIPYLLLEQKLSNWTMSSLYFAKIVFWIFVFLRFVDVFVALFKHRAQKTVNTLDDQLVPIIKNVLKGIIIIIGIFKISIYLGADPKALIAGASIGGLAIGLASQDTVRNLIGTLMIFVDKPFKIGDWIVVDNIEGNVEEVGFRSSIIRSPDTSVYKIPNSKLSEIAINNKGKRIYRRYKTVLGIRYDTPPELIEAFVEGVKKIIEEHPTTRNYSNFTVYNSVPYNVEFIDYGDFSLQILVNVYFMTHDYAEEMHGRHILHLGILNLAKNLGVEFAFPSQTLFMEQFPEKANQFPKYSTDKKNIQKALQESIADFKAKNLKNV